MTKASDERFKTLDSLRGYAAVVVLLSHAYLLVSPFFYGFANPSPIGGSQAVLIFFMISGFVLPLPFLAGKGNWKVYYPTRLLRLYIPTFVAIWFAALLVYFFPRTGLLVDASYWAGNANLLTFRWDNFWEHVLLSSKGFYYNNPVWSLVFEIFFSLLLPLYIWYGRTTNKMVWFHIVLMIGVSTVGTQFDELVFRCMPVFALGVIVAINYETFRELFDKAYSKWGSRKVIVIGLIVSFLGSAFLDIFGYMGESFWVKGLPFAVALTSGFLLFLIFLFADNGLKKVVTNKFSLWLGDLSFSLYLVHVPVIVTIAFLLPYELVPLAIPVSMVVAFAVAVVFRFLIEKPSHEFSQLIKKSLSG